MITKDLINRLRDTASKGVSVWGDLQMEAAKEIETLLAERECYASAMDRMQAALAEPEGEPSTVLRLIDTIKYLVGIAERGKGRKARDDELPEQFVLGYVKRLEAALAEPSEPVAEVAGDYNTKHIIFLPAGIALEVGDKLFTHPAKPEPSEPVGWQLGHRFYTSLKDAEYAWRNDCAFLGTSYVPEPLFTHPASNQLDEIAKVLHYPDCWDVMAYPTLEDAIIEAKSWAHCTNDDCQCQRRRHDERLDKSDNHFGERGCCYRACLLFIQGATDMMTKDEIMKVLDAMNYAISPSGTFWVKKHNEAKQILQAALAEPEGEPATVLRLIDTIKYLVGIAERGEGRKARDDELPEQFVLGYVKRLEAALAEPEPSEPVAWSITYNGEHCGNLYSDEFTAKTKCASMNAMWLKDTRVLVPLFTHPASKPLEFDKDLIQALTERDEYHDMADKLAEGIALHFDGDIGEHSSSNSPWDRALDLLDSAACAETMRLTRPASKPSEPVMIYHGGCTIDCGEHGHHNMEMLKLIPAGTKLFTHPASKPEPLGLTEILDVHDRVKHEGVVVFARAVEAAVWEKMNGK